jgi:hypothetical protein
MFYVYKFVIPSIEILSPIISMIIVVVVVVVRMIIIVVVMIIQVNLGQTCLLDPSKVGQKIIYKRSINNL